MTNSMNFQPLSTQEQMDINGGFVCGGLCVAGFFLLGTAVTVGIAVIAS
jgi:hypothetical protein